MKEGYADCHTLIMYNMACDLTATEELGPGMIFTSFCHHWQAMMFVDAFSSCCIPPGLLLPAWARASVVAILVWSGSSSLYSGLILATFNFALHVWQSVVILFCLYAPPPPPPPPLCINGYLLHCRGSLPCYLNLSSRRYWQPFCFHCTLYSSVAIVCNFANFPN